MGSVWEALGTAVGPDLAMTDLRPLYRTAARQSGVLTVAQLRSAGLTIKNVDYRVRTGEFTRRPGGVVILTGTPESWEQRITAAALAAAPLGAASHRSASRYWGFRTVDDEVEVSIRYPRKLTIPGAIVHRSVDLVENDITWIDGVPVTTPERTLCDLGLVLPETEVMRILRHAIAIGLVNRRDLWHLRVRIGKSGRDGAGIIGRCLSALPRDAEYVESGLEVMFLEICERHGLPIPAIQLPVVVRGKRYRLDFAFPAERVFVEIDGRWHGEPHQIAKDGGRQNDLVAAGWRPIRFEYDRLRLDPPGIAADLRSLLSTR